jgi:glutamate/tyrosine decarboxylase-like PLP-dependent enzyme
VTRDVDGNHLFQAEVPLKIRLDEWSDKATTHINYLGADQASFTLNFSKGASHVIGQYYQLIRLGKQSAGSTAQ